MPISTYYISIFILINILLASCSQLSSIGLTDNYAAWEDARNPEAEIELYQQGITYLNDNKLDEAESILLAFTDNRPELAGPWANLGLIQLKRNNIDEAEKLVKKALEKNPQMAQASNLLGVIENKRGNIKQAQHQYIRAIYRKNDYAIAHYNLALLYDVYLQDIKNAIKHYQRYLKLIKNKDQKTADWLEELKRSLK